MIFIILYYILLIYYYIDLHCILLWPVILYCRLWGPKPVCEPARGFYRLGGERKGGRFILAAPDLHFARSARTRIHGEPLHLPQGCLVGLCRHHATCECAQHGGVESVLVARAGSCHLELEARERGHV